MAVPGSPREPDSPTEPHSETKPKRRRFHHLRRVGKYSGHTGMWITLACILVAVVVIVGSLYIDEPLRRRVEAAMNSKLVGYSVKVPRLHFSLFDLSVTAKDLVLRQDAHSDPPVLVVPRLYASVQWKELLTLHLVANFEFDRPRLRVDLRNFQRESRDSIPITQKGLQEALEQLYPLKINHMQFRDGDLMYVDADSVHALHLSHLELQADNIRNIHSSEHDYPSPLHARAAVFTTGTATFDGHADFLARPWPGFRLLFTLESVPLDTLSPMLRREGIALKGGTLETQGDLELAPIAKLIRTKEVIIRNTQMDFIHSDRLAGKSTVPEKLARQATRQPVNATDLKVEMERLRVVDSNIGYIDATKHPQFRLFVSQANLTVDNFSNQYVNGPARAQLTGLFMGSGSTRASAAFRAERAGRNFDLNIAIEHTQLTSLNPMLESFGKFKVTRGEFFFFTEVTVKNHQISGYVKPLFRDMKIYTHDKGFKKIYEKIISLVTKILRNKHGDVATVVTLSGPADSPNGDTWEAILGMLGNAFIKAILPGFDHEVYKMGMSPKPGNKAPPLPPRSAVPSKK